MNVYNLSIPAALLIHETDEDETGYWAEVLNLPGCLTQGDTLEELYDNILEAIVPVQPHPMTDTVGPSHNLRPLAPCNHPHRLTNP